MENQQVNSQHLAIIANFASLMKEKGDKRNHSGYLAEFTHKMFPEYRHLALNYLEELIIRHLYQMPCA